MLLELEVESERPRVLIVTPQPFYEDRGTPIAVSYVARALSEIGVDVDVLAFPIGRDVAIRNVYIRRCANFFGFKRVPIGFSWKKLVLDASLWTSFIRLLSRRRYDMVHAVEEAAYIAAAICPRFGQPFIYDMASAIPVELQRQRMLSRPRVQRVLTRMQRWVLERATQVVCSPGLAEYVHSQAPDVPVREWRFPAQPPNVTQKEAEGLRKRLGIAADRKVVLYSGSFAGYQGVDLLLEAFIMAREHNPTLMLVCVGATEKEMEVWTPRIPESLRDHVRIVPRQPRERIATYIQLADFLALPRGQTDNVPLKLFEYMASGKPIIAMRSAAYGPLLDTTRAFICDADAPSLAEAINHACRSPLEAHSMAHRSEQYAARQFGWGRFVDFVRTTYSESIFSSQARRRAAQVG